MLSKHQEFLGAESNLESGFFGGRIVPAAVFYRHRVDHTSKEQESIDINMSRPLGIKTMHAQNGSQYVREQ